MSVVVAYEELGPCQKKLTIEVPPPDVEAETGRVIREYAKKANLPGFRRGKVPANLVRKRFQQEIEEEVAGRLVPRYLQQAQDEKNLEPLLPPQIEDLKTEPGGPMRIVASIETRPEIAALQLKGFNLPTEDVTPNDAEIAAAIEDLQRQAATWKTADRPAARGDRVIGTVVELTDEAEEADEKPLEIELVGEKADDELLLALTGVAAGQSTEISRKIGQGEETREARFLAQISAVEERELPELDDEFARRMGDFADLAALREAVIQQVALLKGRDLKVRREKALFEQLRDRHPLQVPDRLIEREIERMLRDYAERLAAQGVDFMKADIDWRRLGEDLRPQAERRAHVDLLLDVVARTEDIQLDEGKLESFLAQSAQQQGLSSAAFKRHLVEAGRLKDVKESFLRDTVIRRLLGESDQDPIEASGDAGDRDASDRGEDSVIEVLPVETQD